MSNNLIFLLVGALIVTVIVVRRVQAARAARKLIDAGALVLDVRSKAEWDQGHVASAHLFPVNELGARLKEIEKLAAEKAQPIVVYCRSGARSAQAKQILQQAGYSAVTNGGGYASLR